MPVFGGLDEVANQTVTFEMAAGEDLRLARPVTANLRSAATRGWARTEDTARSTSVEIAVDLGDCGALIPGVPVTVPLSLTAGPTMLRTGDGLRLQLASRTDLLRSGVSHGRMQVDLPVPPYLSRSTVHFGGTSWLDVTRPAHRWRGTMTDHPTDYLVEIATGYRARVRDQGTGRPPVLLHGTPFDESAWDPLVRALGGRCRTIRYDASTSRPRSPRRWSSTPAASRPSLP